MPKIVTVEFLKAGDRFEFITSRSEWRHDCFLTHPQGVVLVAKSAFLDRYNQSRFGWRLEKFPSGRCQDWWGLPQTQVRLLGALPTLSNGKAKRPIMNKKALRK